MSITTVGSHIVHYEALGRGEPVIFIHGLIGSWRYWWTSMQSLSQHYRTFALDLWGFGDSSKLADKYTCADYVELLDGFVDRMGITRPVTLVGHSLGAAVALRYAMAGAESVDHLAGVALPVNGNNINGQFYGGNGDVQIDRLVAKDGPFPEVTSEIHKTDRLAVAALADELRTCDFRSDLQTARCPVLLVFGELDPIVRQPTSTALGWNGGQHDRALISLPGCSHFPMLENGAVFNRLILDFMRANGDLTGLSPKEYWQRRTH